MKRLPDPWRTRIVDSSKRTSHGAPWRKQLGRQSAPSSARGDALDRVEQIAQEVSDLSSETRKAYSEAITESADAAKDAHGAARSAEASAWSAQKDATRATRAVRAVGADIEERTDAIPPVDRAQLRWDELMDKNALQEAKKEEAFWTLVNDDPNEEEIDEDDDQWGHRLRRRLFGQKSES